jgi:hypothetical protein
MPDNYNDMEDIFEKVGKRMSYKVPDGFFDDLSLKTLEKAKAETKSDKGRFSLSQRNNRKIVFRKLIFTVSAAAVIMLALFSVFHDKVSLNDDASNYGVTEVISDFSDDEVMELSVALESDPFFD